MKPNLVIGIVGSAAILVVGVFVGTRRAGSHPPVVRLVRPAPVLPKEVPALKAFIATNEKSKDPKVQDLVGASKIRIAYKKAEKRDFTGARDTLLQTVRTYRGTGRMSSDFGGVADQAAYQAAVCLVAEGKNAEARKAFVSFLHDWPMSPLGYAAYRRIKRIDGRDTPGLQLLLEKNVEKQAKRGELESSACGPKCVAHVLPLLGKPAEGYGEIARECGTSLVGTTIEQIQQAFKRRGIRTYAFELGGADFAKAPTPLLLLSQDHFVVVEKFTNNQGTVYDPRFESVTTRSFDLDPAKPNSVLLFSPPALAD